MASGTVLTTGANSGIGLASALELARLDAQLIALTDMVLPTALRDRLARLVLGL